MRPLILWLALGLGIALGSLWLGWWTVPALGLLWGVWMAREGRPGLSAASSAAVAWAALLWMTTAGDPLAELASTLGAIFGIPAVAVIAVTLLFPAALAGLAATTGAAIRHLIAGPSDPDGAATARTRGTA